MKARKVRDLDPDGRFIDNARRFAAVRIDEVWALGESAHDPHSRDELHNMRIAAKRLRYLLEMTEPCFGEPALKGAKLARKLQDRLGAIHDCDVMSERVRNRAHGIPVKDDRYLGLEALASFLEARRRVLHREFVDYWTSLEQEGFRARLEAGLGVTA